MTDTLRIAHCSDIHLDGEHYGSSDGEVVRAAFAAALAEMRDHAPHLMLLAGDLFDSNRARPDTIEWAMEMLSRQPFPVLMIPGNHDCLQESAIYHRYDFNRIANTTMLAAEEGEIVRLPELGVAAWGKGMVEHSTEFRPIGGCPDRPEGCRWYLGLGHGLFVPHGEQTYRASPIHMGEIEASAFDYLALGHHHAAMELVTDKATAAYCGSPTDSAGRGPTYAMVDLAVGRAPILTVHTVRPSV